MLGELLGDDLRSLCASGRAPHRSPRVLRARLWGNPSKHGLRVRYLRLLNVGLRGNGDKFPRRHRHRPRGQACHTRDDHRALAGICCCNADNQGGHRHDAIVRPKHRRTQPIAAGDVMRFARVCRRIRHIQFAFVVLTSLARNQHSFDPSIGGASHCAKIACDRRQESNPLGRELICGYAIGLDQSRPHGRSAAFGEGDIALKAAFCICVTQPKRPCGSCSI